MVGSVLFVKDNHAVQTLVLGAHEIRGGAALAGLLKQLPKLTALDLSSCPFLHSLPEEIGALVAMRELLLVGDTRLPKLPDALTTLTAMHTLDLSGCESLVALPESIGALVALQRLYLTQMKRDFEEKEKEEEKEDEKSGPNRRKTASAAVEGPGITSLPDAICTLPALRHLSVGLAMLKALPERIGELSSLRTLSLTGSISLTALPASTGQLASLEYFELPDYSKALPETLLNGMSKLITLDLYGCTALTSLPPSFGACAASLQTMYIGSLELGELPDAICGLKALKHLDMRVPSLTQLPAAFGSLGSLESLYITHANIASLPESMGQLGALKVLRLSRCAALASLPESMSECKALEYLEVAECNALGSLPSGFGALPNLMGVDFPGCEDLGDKLYDDPVVDELEARGVGMFGPGIEIETAKYVEIKRRCNDDEDERKVRLTGLRATVV